MARFRSVSARCASLLVVVAIGATCQASADPQSRPSPTAKGPKKKGHTDRARTQGTGGRARSPTTTTEPKPEVADAPVLALPDIHLTTDTTPSGVSIVAAERPEMASSSVVVRLGFGSAADPADRGGLVALAAQASVLRSVAAREAFAARGGRQTIAIDPDGVTFSLDVPGDDPTLAIDLVAAELREPLDAGSIATARSVFEPDLASDAKALTLSLAYEGFAPYGHRAFGSRVYLDKVSDADVDTFHHDRFATGVARVVFVVPRDGARAMTAAKSAFSDAKGPTSSDPPAALPEQTNQRASDIEAAGAPEALHYAWALRDAAPDDVASLEVAAALLGEGGRIEASLGKAGIVGSVDVRLERRKGPSVLTLDVALLDGVDPSKAKHAIDDLLADAGKHAASPAEIARAERALSIAEAAALDDPLVFARGIASDPTMPRDHQITLRAVTPERIEKAVARFLGPLTRSVVETHDPSRVVAHPLLAMRPPPSSDAAPKHVPEAKKSSKGKKHP